MEMNEVLKEVGKAIPYYAHKVAAKSSIEFEDAEQELLICAWTSSVKYEKSQQGCEFTKFAMANLYFKSLKMVERSNKVAKRESDLLRNWAITRPSQDDSIEDLCNEIAFEQEISRLPSTVRDTLAFRAEGMTQDEIAEQLGINRPTVRKILQKH
jgi:RNA polymerase sigma factor (sigma-70 family)